MRDDAPEFGPVAFHFDEGPPKLGLFRALCECILEQTAEAVLLALNPKDVLNFLASACARNVSGQKQTTKDFSTAEPGRLLEGFKVGEMLIADPYPDEVPKTPHWKSIGSVRRLSSADLVSRVRITCANKPKALSTSIKRGAANGEEFARRTCSFVKQNSSLPEQAGSFFGAEWRSVSPTVTRWHFRNTRCHSMAHSRKKASHRAKRRQATTGGAT